MILVLALLVVGLFIGYRVVESGELILPNAPGVVSIMRESDTKIMHIRGEDLESISYGQGFACAQTRLWQMEKQRRVAKGRLSELFGKDALVIDEFMRYIGMERTSKATWDEGKVGSDYEKMAQAFANGVNDFV